MTNAVSIAQYGSNNPTFRNRIINGAMQIDQRNAGASVSATDAAYTLDRWKTYASQTSKFTVQQNAGSVTPPAGYINYLGVTSSSAYTVGASERFAIVQQIEGLNVADLAWGTASAASVTLSFKVYSSLTGTFGGSIVNSAYTRSYPFSYTISSANTWTTISVTIAGDTTGTWLTTNGVGIAVWFGLGVGSSSSNTAGAWAAGGYLSATGATSVVGTNGATFYITGVQLEKGSTATSFDYRPYGQELALCQRYYWRLSPSGTTQTMLVSGMMRNASTFNGQIRPPVTMRSAPSVSSSSATSAFYISTAGDANSNSVVALAGSAATADSVCVSSAVTSGSAPSGQGAILYNNATTTSYIELSAEL